MGEPLLGLGGTATLRCSPRLSLCRARYIVPFLRFGGTATLGRSLRRCYVGSAWRLPRAGRGGGPLSSTFHPPSFRAKQADAFSSRFAPATRSAWAERTAAPSRAFCAMNLSSLHPCSGDFTSPSRLTFCVPVSSFQFRIRPLPYPLPTAKRIGLRSELFSQHHSSSLPESHCSVPADNQSGASLDSYGFLDGYTISFLPWSIF
jgi:hypothetical protein